MLGLKPIKTLPIREKIAATLREAILAQKISAGEVLTLEQRRNWVYPSHRYGRLFRSSQGTGFWN